MVGARLLAEQAQVVESAVKEGQEETARTAAATLDRLLGETLEVARPLLDSA
jgi:NTP pyrophosphatase (non-canonical NTP hydrolase)